MWCRLALCVVLSSCGFRSQAVPGNAPGSDAPGGDAPGSDASGSDASGDGPAAAAGCFQHWLDGVPGLVLSSPQELITPPSSTDDRDPWISTDGRRLYFARNPGAHGGNDIYLATRTSPAGDFTTLQAMDNLDTGDQEERASLNGDETLLIFSGNHNTTGGRFQLFVSKRSNADPFPSPPLPDQALVASVHVGNDSYLDPFLTPDGLVLYLTRDQNGAASPPKIVRATRGAGQDFPAATEVPMINSSSGEADPAVSRDGRIIVFSSHRAAGALLGATNLWYATRQNATDDFSAPKLIPNVNSDQDDGDPVLSDDGCELYFASTRAGGNKYHLFHAQVTK